MKNKTVARIIDEHSPEGLNLGDTGYIDGYTAVVMGTSFHHHAIFVRDTDGYIEAVNLRCIEVGSHKDLKKWQQEQKKA